MVKWIKIPPIHKWEGLKWFKCGPQAQCSYPMASIFVVMWGRAGQGRAWNPGKGHVMLAAKFEWSYIYIWEVQSCRSIIQCCCSIIFFSIWLYSPRFCMSELQRSYSNLFVTSKLYLFFEFVSWLMLRRSAVGHLAAWGHALLMESNNYSFLAECWSFGQLCLRLWL